MDKEYHPDNPNIIEVRKGEAGTRAWTANPGEYNNAFDGKYGGMWRARGRIPSKVCGLTLQLMVLMSVHVIKMS